MGVSNVSAAGGIRARRRFIKNVLSDVEALETMLRENMFETGIKRMGAELEMAIADRAGLPALKSMEFLDIIDDDHFTTELAQFNIEVNFDPILIDKNCLSKLSTDLNTFVGKARTKLELLDAQPILVGILPTIKSGDLVQQNITPLQRYHVLADALNKRAGGTFRYVLNGIDELIGEHNSMMMESCNTSYQLHLQVDPDEFAKMYNWTQVISAPLLAASTNSPMLLGKRVWRETRISLFRQSIDTRSSFDMLRGKSARVIFGHGWVKDSVAELFIDDVVRHAMLLSADVEENSIEVLKEGRIPQLQALMVHNGTIYRWNRPCYGVAKGVPHLRIENRILPSGPSIPDMVANAALWYGLMLGMPSKYENLPELMDFDDARDNFTMAARSGLQTRFKWMNERVVSAPELIIEELLPIARKGLSKYGIPKKEIDKNLDIIENRVTSGRTGSQWALDSYAKLKKVGTREEAMLAITAGMAKRQKKNLPVHEWTLAELDEAGDWANSLSRVEQIMTIDLVTVREHDLIDLVEKLMTWWGIHHVPVEDTRGKLIGLVTSSVMERFRATVSREGTRQLAIKHIMKPVPYTCSPQTPTAEAIRMMKEKKVGALMVVNDDKLVGIITKEDIKNIADRLPKEMIED